MKLINSITKASRLGLLLFFVSSCILSIPKEKRSCYKELKRFANEHWKFSHNDSVLVENKVLFEMAISKHGLKQCILGLEVKDIERIFGNPHEIVLHSNGTIGRFFYYTMFCYPSVAKAKGCIFYEFDFNKKGECVMFGTGGS